MPPEALAPVPEDQLLRAQTRVSAALRTKSEFASLVDDLLEEVRNDYHLSVRMAIGNVMFVCCKGLTIVLIVFCGS